MSFYRRYQEAWDKKDLDSLLELYHPDYKRVFHKTGAEQGFEELESIMTRWLLGTSRNQRRCLYENDEIVVEHFIADFQDGSKEAVLTVHLLKEGLLWRSETGATPVTISRP